MEWNEFFALQRKVYDAARRNGTRTGDSIGDRLFRHGLKMFFSVYEDEPDMKLVEEAQGLLKEAGYELE